jgi:hypothetical protein
MENAFDDASLFEGWDDDKWFAIIWFWANETFTWRSMEEGGE